MNVIMVSMIDIETVIATLEAVYKNEVLFLF